jgi:hypothetical protein
MKREISDEKWIDQMAERWPSPVVARKRISEFSGGVLSQKTMANFDSNGEGPEGRFLLVNQTVYPVESLVAWLKTRMAPDWKSRKRAAVNQ